MLVVPAAVRKEPVSYCAVLSPVMRFIKVAKGSKVVIPLRAISQLHAVGQHHQPAWLEHPAVQHRSPTHRHLAPLSFGNSTPLLSWKLLQCP